MMRLHQNNILGPALVTMPAAGASDNGAVRFAILEERGRLACEIHDTLAQAFAGILLHLEAVPKRGGGWRQRDSDCARRLARVKHLARGGLEDARRMLLGLRPRSLDGASLVGALKELAEHSSVEWRITCKFRVIGQAPDLPTDLQDELYRIAQEALSNVRKHAHATSVSVLLDCEPEMIALTVKDNGRGFVAGSRKTVTEGFGLTSMRERAFRIGASLNVSGAPGEGTEVRVSVSRTSHRKVY